MRFTTKFLYLIILLCVALPGLTADKSSKKDSNPLASIPLRNIGPAMISGRISHFAFHPDRKHEFYVATASGNLWKTSNNTITWEPIFDNEGSYSLGYIAIDQQNPLILWVGTGENNAQRSVAYGDGVYKSTDGGKTWKNVGLKDSGHISQIWIHPEDSNTVLVAAQGPLWSDGGDRGLYKTTDGGATWEQILSIDKYTGVNEFVVDPRNFDNIVASSYQRRRHVWVLINGGPGSGVHKTTDGGKSWKEVNVGLPKDHMGRIGLAGAPSNPDMIYAIIEAQKDQQGVFRSTDFGQNWKKQSSYMTNSPQYYNELVIDPHNAERLYSLNTFTNISEDGGKSWKPLSLKFRHVDDHALWIDPDNTDHLYIGGDGGIYETWDRGQTWRHVRNLPIAQFYRIQPDNAEPFYNVCGGTQDNNSLCGPSRTNDIHGIDNSDWHIILGGDGYKPQIDPNDPNIIYPQYQYGGLARYDRRTEERVYITPHPKSGEKQYKWNWNSPLLISPHKPTRLYYAAEKLFRSEDRGDSWEVISPDLTRQLDRNQLEVMDRVWSVDTISKNKSTSMYGSIIGLSESPVQEGLIYVGTDDGLISVTDDGGENWNTVRKFSSVPDMSLVEDIVTSVHDADVAYAVFDNHKRGDYKPYVLKTTDRGRSWKSITGNLPARGSAHTIAEDHVDPNLLFVGTEFGLFFSQNGGQKWHALKNNFPTIAVRDIEIQRRENDLVVGTFGRGIYILDDYTPLRFSSEQLKQQAATLFPIKDAWLYIQGDQFDDREKGSSGSEFYNAANPPYGASISYYLKDEIKTRKKTRRAAEIKKEKAGEDTPYPSWDELRKEDQEESPSLMLVVKNAQGEIIKRIKGKTKKGFHRATWDMRLTPPDAVSLKKPGFVPYWVTPPMGPLAVPGQYTVTLMKRQDGALSALSEPQTFTLKSLDNSSEITENPVQRQAFQQRLGELMRTTEGANSKMGEIANRIKHLREAVRLTSATDENHAQQLHQLHSRYLALKTRLQGDQTISSRSEPVPWSVNTRVYSLYGGIIESQADVPGNYRDSMAIAQSELTQVLGDLSALDNDLKSFEAAMEQLGAPWTPGRIPELK
ncbi:WD40/YVTN/BNR-like repeat-containing protein [Marinicella sp. W31]|uniref:WD40/YVTN/BNR-like repeat-containing protein n=1 Tax=Marinicella sp. W31 TaxID=3023713 RepID=UPI003757E9A6